MNIPWLRATNKDINTPVYHECNEAHMFCSSDMALDAPGSIGLGPPSPGYPMPFPGIYRQVCIWGGGWRIEPLCTKPRPQNTFYNVVGGRF